VKWLPCVDGVYFVADEHFSDVALGDFEMPSPGVEVRDGFIYVCRWQTDDEDDRVEFSCDWRRTVPDELEQWAAEWPFFFRGRVKTSSPLELFTLELEPMGVLTPRWAGGMVEFQLFIRLADPTLIGPGEPREQHMLVLWPSSPPVVWFEGEE